MKKYDFAGWVTKNDVLCSDGVVIKHGAFQENDQAKVPLVWQHKHDDPTNVLGHVILHNRDEGVYGFGYFNQTDKASHAKSMVTNGDISSMSIAANKLKRMGQNIVHGSIFEVSLVLRGANPGALILEHSDNVEREEMQLKEDEILFYPKMLLHSAEDILIKEDLPENDTDLQHEEGGSKVADNEKTIGEVLETMNEEQRDAVEALVANILSEDDDIEQGDDLEMKQNVFEGGYSSDMEVLTHAESLEILDDARSTGTLKEAFLQHGITNIETLFPDAHTVTNEPVIFRDENTGAQEIVNSANKSPFARVKTHYADFTEDEARARGYIKGNEKIEQVFEVASRETTPQTIYKKQQLDRDDIIDITDFDVVRFINKEMRFMLIEELGRAILVGDGRLISDASKIKEDKIRPIIKDDDFYTLKKTFTDETDLVEKVVLGMADYKGSGAPVAYIDPTLLAKVKLLKGTDGRYLTGKILSNDEVATQLGVTRVVPTTLMAGKGLLIVNLRDYTIGSTKGGEVTTFDDFDIDFNKYKYLIETRLSGALTLPHSALYFSAAPAGN